MEFSRVFSDRSRVLVPKPSESRTIEKKEDYHTAAIASVGTSEPVKSMPQSNQTCSHLEDYSLILEHSFLLDRDQSFMLNNSPRLKM